LRVTAPPAPTPSAASHRSCPPARRTSSSGGLRRGHGGDSRVAGDRGAPVPRAGRRSASSRRERLLGGWLASPAPSAPASVRATRRQPARCGHGAGFKRRTVGVECPRGRRRRARAPREPRAAASPHWRIASSIFLPVERDRPPDLPASFARRLPSPIAPVLRFKAAS